MNQQRCITVIKAGLPSCLLVFALLMLPDKTQAAVTAPPIETWLAEQGIAASEVALIAQPLDGGQALVQLNPQVAFNPASTMKLLTTHAALSMLGPDYRWHTDAFLRGELIGGRLKGDLILRGGGDPKLVIEDLQQFVAMMRSAGLRDLHGDLVLDDSVFDVGAASIESFDGDPTQPYNVRPFGLLMNFKSTRVVVHSNGHGSQVRLDPALDGVRIDNRLRVRQGRCVRSANVLAVSERKSEQAPSQSDLDRAAARERSAALIVSGSYMPSCGELGSFVSVFDHRAFIDGLFRAVWRESGGSWHGVTRIERGSASGDPWLRWQSPRTLNDVVQDINKFSNNVMARQLLLQLAHEAGRRPATQRAAQQVLRTWLTSQQLSLPGLVLDNGSGLSRTARVSVQGMASLLVHAAGSRDARLLRESMPVVGIDGTMKYRMAGEPVAGRAWIKTGSLVDVRTMAGYLDAASGRRYAMALFYNGPRPSAIVPVQEKLLRWLHRNG